MKKMILPFVFLMSVIISPAQGIYQFWAAVSSGTLFSTDTVGNNFQPRHRFTDEIEGIFPSGNVVQLNGKFYGMTSVGNNISDGGVIFEWDPFTKTYTKKISFDGINGAYPRGSLTLSGGKFYGMTTQGGSKDSGVIFEWDPAANVYTKKVDLVFATGEWAWGNLTLHDGKFYGMTSAGGLNNSGVIFEWDPVTNVYTKKIDFGGANGSKPYGSLTPEGEKFYGRTHAGGSNGKGVIFEWEPLTNVYTKKYDFTAGDTTFVASDLLTMRNGKFYGVVYGLGEQDRTGTVSYGGELFEWDPSTNVYTKKIDLDSVFGQQNNRDLTLSGNKLYGISGFGSIFEWDPDTNIYTGKSGNSLGADLGNDLTLFQAPVANGLPGSCINFAPVTIDNGNNNKWVAIADSLGDAVAEIKANGNNLGIVNVSMYINNAAVREDANKRLYLDRNITMTPAVQPTSAVDIRLYIKGSEFLALKNTLNSNGDSSGISSINDIGIYKNGDDCLSAVSSALTNSLTTTAQAWQNNYVLTASIPSFSSFYFAKNTPGCPAPVIQCKADTVVNATERHCGAIVTYKSPILTGNCEEVTMKQTAGLHSGAFFPVGNTINTFVATSSSGKKDSCSFTVTVKDNKAPFITPAVAFPALLWPPDHQLKNVAINYFAWDNCGPASCSLSVSSNEPARGTGYGDKAPDWVILDKHHVKLRAERSGSGNGRVYTVTVTCTDSSGNASIQKTRVFVPRDVRRHYKKGAYDFDNDNDGYIDGKGDYFDNLFSCTVSPNPSRQNFNLEIRSASEEKIEVNLFDVTGKFISKLNAIKNNILRFGDDLRPGVYMVQIRQGQQQETIKVVKQ